MSISLTIAQTLLGELSTSEAEILTTPPTRELVQARDRLRQARKRLRDHVNRLTRDRLCELKLDPRFGLLQSYSHRTRLLPSTESPYTAWLVCYQVTEAARLLNYIGTLTVEDSRPTTDRYDWLDHLNRSPEMWSRWILFHNLYGLDIYRLDLLTGERRLVRSLSEDPCLFRWQTESFRDLYDSQHSATQADEVETSSLTNCVTPSGLPRWKHLGDLLMTVDLQRRLGSDPIDQA